MTVSVLVVTGGHPFESEAFFAFVDSIPGITWTAASTPATGHDVVLLYDMPGLDFTGGDPPVKSRPPTAEVLAVWDDLRRTGTGLVALHHAIASWPAWPEFATMMGGRFHYGPGTLQGVHYPDSGYVFDVEHRVEVLDPLHPVCAGVGASFTIRDELYCFPVLASRVHPLMRTTFPVRDSRNFRSADAAIRRRSDAGRIWTHPPGSDLIAWATSADSSPLVYVQCGDGPTAYANESFRRIVANAIRWTASAEARQWAANWSSRYGAT